MPSQPVAAGATVIGPMRIFLITSYVIFILLLLPWIPVAFWFTSFLMDDVRALPLSALFSLKNVIIVMVLLYPVFVFHAALLSWRSLRLDHSKPRIICLSLLPLLSIVPLASAALMISIARGAA